MRQHRGRQRAVQVGGRRRGRRLLAQGAQHLCGVCRVAHSGLLLVSSILDALQGVPGTGAHLQRIQKEQ